MTGEGKRAVSGTARAAHPAGGGIPRTGARPAPAAAAIAVLCLGVAGCAAVRTGDPVGRQAVIDRIVAASAKVTVEKAGRRIASGSGVVVATRIEEPGGQAVSYVLTAAHVLEGKDGSVFVRFARPQAAGRKFAATVFRQGNPETLDLSLLRVPGIAVVPASFPAEDEVRLGEEILVVGFPWGRRLGLFGGIVSQVPSGGNEGATKEDGTDETLVVDAAAARGVSGGGVFRESTGALLGIVEGYQTASIAVKDRSQTYSLRVPLAGETFVVPMARIRRFLEDAGLDGTSGSPERAGHREG